jgi:hypothetical protein
MKSSCYFVFNHSVLLCRNPYPIFTIHAPFSSCTLNFCTLLDSSLIQATTGLRYIGSARTTQETQFHGCLAQTTQKTRHVIAISPLHWRDDCCLATSYKHSSYCCVRVSRGVYQAVAWQCVDMSQYYIATYISDLYTGFGLVNRFIGSSILVTTIGSYTLKITATIAHVTSHTKSSNSPSGNTVVPLELRNSSEVNSHSRILYPLGTDHAQKTQPLYCCIGQNTLKKSHVIAISPVHWRADCCLSMRYKHTSYCCVTLSKVFITPLPRYTRYIILWRKDPLLSSESVNTGRC